MNKLSIFVSLFVWTTFVYSNNNIIAERSSFTLKLSVDNENYVESAIPKTPYVFNKNNVQFYPGEKLFLEAEVINDSIVQLTVVNEIIHKEKTITVKFYQTTDEKNPRIHQLMFLEVTNPFAKILEYKANIFLTQYNKWKNTSIIPIPPGMSAYESWPDIITAIVLHGFKLK